MAIGSSLAGQVGLVAESVYGTAVTVTRFPEVTGAKLQYKPTFVQGGGLRAGTFSQSGNRRVVTTSQAGGTLEHELTFAKMGVIIQALMGTSVTPVQQAATTAYLQTHTLADPAGKSLTIQQGIPQTDGTVRAHTYAGCKIASAEFSCAVDEIAKVVWEVDAKSYTDQTALASASYTASDVFHFAHMGLKLGTFNSEAAVTGVRSVSLKIDRALATDRFYANGLGAKAEPLLGGWTAITGSIETDFVTKVDYLDRFAANTSTSLVYEFVGPSAIASTYFPTFRVTVPGVFFDEGSPTLDAATGEIVKVTHPFTWQYDGTNLPFITYMSTDTVV